MFKKKDKKEEEQQEEDQQPMVVIDTEDGHDTPLPPPPPPKAAQLSLTAADLDVMILALETSNNIEVYNQAQAGYNESMLLEKLLKARKL